jgi:hypothetical protein
MNDIYILNKEHPDFIRLYWSSDKDRIKHILSRVNVKYFKGLMRRFTTATFDEWYGISSDDMRVFLRYDGYQFTVSHKTIIKELYRRGI